MELAEIEDAQKNALAQSGRCAACAANPYTVHI